MKRAFWSSGLLLTLILAAGCSHRGAMEHASTQDNFGVQMARMNLWREAMFRFQRAVQIDPSSASAHNNLAVAYEANGDFDSAAKEYREALRLDRSNQYIQKNYSRFVEFLSRNKKRQQKQEPKPATPAGAQTPPVPAAPTPITPPQPVPPIPGTENLPPGRVTPPPVSPPPSAPPHNPPGGQQ